MKSALFVACFTTCGLIFMTVPAHAQLGKVLREGAEAVSQKVFRESAEAGAQKAAQQASRVAARKTLQESGEALLRKSASGLGDNAARLAARHGDAVVAPLVGKFGDDAAQALGKLSPRQARRLALVGEELAATGRGADWLRVIAEKGDVAADWVWANKGSLALTTVGVAFLADPDAFLSSGERLATTAVVTAGHEVARPLIEESAKHVAPAVVEKVLTPVAQRAWEPLRLLIYLLLAAAPIVVLVGWLGYGQPLVSLRQSLVSARK
jgi:hypothetical protein